MLNTKTKVIIGSLGICIFSFPVLAHILTLPFVSAEETTFEVNVVESLSVSLTTPSTWASGNINTFLRNDVNLKVTSNNANGFTASMYANTGSSNHTALMNSAIELPTLNVSSTRGDFPANHWGYSLGSGSIDSSLNSNTYGETSAGNTSSNYYPLTGASAPVVILNSSSAVSEASQDIYFGAKGGMSQASGTYSGTVVISVVSGVTDSSTNPVTPTDPARPTDDTPNDNQATYTGAGTTTGGTTNGATIYTTRTSNAASGSTPATETTTTEISDGDTRSSYAAPAGVIENSASNISDGSMLTTGLVVASSAAAASGMLFFIVAKRREEDEEDEETI